MTLLTGATLLNPLADLASPTFTGTPAAPTVATANSSTDIATTAYVQANLASYAPLASPSLTGTPLAPTASSGTSTTQIATTAFVQNSELVTGATLSMNTSQTTTFTASAGGFYPCSTSGAGFTATLPTAPSNGTTCIFMKTDTSTNALTISRGGSTDVINSSGVTSIALTYMNAVACLKYNASLAIWYNVEANNVSYVSWLVQGGTRQTGYGDMPEGIFLAQAATLLAVQFRIGTADASGTSTIALYSNTTNASTGSALTSGSTSLTTSTTNNKITLTGPWTITAGTFLQVNATAVGTTPGNRLYADLYLVMN